MGPELVVVGVGDVEVGDCEVGGRERGLGGCWGGGEGWMVGGEHEEHVQLFV